MTALDRDSRQGDRSRVLANLTSTFLVLLTAVVLAGGQQQLGDRTGGPLQVAQGILVQPNAGDLEPPSIADENSGGQQGSSGEEVPPDLDQRGAVIIQEPVPVPQDAEPRINRPDARQDDVERGGARQGDLETPEGPGIRY